MGFPSISVLVVAAGQGLNVSGATKKDSFGTCCCCCALLSPWRCIDMDGQKYVSSILSPAQRRPPSQPRQNWIADLCAGHFPLAPIRFVTLSNCSSGNSHSKVNDFTGYNVNQIDHLFKCYQTAIILYFDRIGCGLTAR